MIAFCKFCGQTFAAELPEDCTEEQAAEIGTAQCRCPEAQEQQKRLAAAELAKGEITDLCLNPQNGAGFARVDDDVVKLLYNAVDMMAEREIHKITVAVSAGGNIAVSCTTSGKFQIVRSRNYKQKREAE